MAERDWRPLAYDYAPYGIVAAIFAFMLWIRTRATDRVVQEDVVFFSGNDPWYHSRMVHIIVRHFPATANFDPWSRFPYGTGRHSGFGGLFDQLIALAALVLGGGNPNPHFVDVVTAFAPPVFGAATAIPAYLIARRLTDRWSGLVAIGLLALAGGQFLTRTIVGTADHQSAESFFGAIAILGFLYAVGTVYREQPTTADLRDRNWIVLRRPIAASLLGGVAIASYLMMWPPGVMLAFTMGVFVVLQTIRDYLRGQSTEYLTFGTVLPMAVAGVLTLLHAKSYGVQQAAFSLLQPIVVFGIAGGAVVLYLLANYMREEGYESRYYPIAVVVLLVGTFAVASLVFPKTFDLMQNLIKRVYSFGLLRSPSAGTVAEIRPADLNDAWRAFGAVFYLALAGLTIMVARVIQENRPAELLVVLWSLTIFSAYFSMIRFGYYMAVNVAILAGFAIWWASHHLLAIDASILDDLGNLEAYQIIGVLVLLIAVVPGNVVAVQDRQPVWETADRFGGTDQAWHNELTWMRGNTPEEPLDYYGLYERPEDGDFDYPPDAYGVMSWWDYGHWITTQAHRIPFANPFQQGPNVASAYLQAQSEERANLILDAIPSLEEEKNNIDDLSNEELRSIAESQSEQRADEDIRYVVIDDQMLGGKFAAIATWTGPGYGAYISRQGVQIGQQQGQTAQLPGVNDRYRSMIMYRLYFADARGLDHYRLVHESRQTSAFVSIARQTPNNAWTSDVNGDGRGGDFVNRRLSQQVFTAVQRRPDLAFYDTRQASRVKVYERVEGATLTGQVETENATRVFATVPLQTNTGRNFTYIQQVETDENGEFTMTVPYATNDAVDPADGGTDSGVTAQRNYSLIVGNPFQPSARGNADVPESAIYEGRTVEVELEAVNQSALNVTAGDRAPAGVSGASSDRAIDDPSLPSTIDGRLVAPERVAR